MKVLFTAAVLSALALPAIGQVSEAEWNYYSHPRAVDENVSREIERINRECEENIRRIREWQPDLRQPRQQSNASTVPAKPRGGIQFSCDSPQPASRRGSTQTTARKQHNDAQHRAWLEERRAQRERDEQHRREVEYRRREADRIRRQQIYDAAYAVADAVAAQRAARLTAEARWRTGEGAEILDRTHTAERLMTADTRKNFGSGAVAGRHRLGTLSTAKKGFLDSRSIPWGTMGQDAKPWSEWEKDCREAYAVALRPQPPLQPVKMKWSNAWEEMSHNIPPDRMNMLKAVVYFANDGVIPQMYYDTDSKKYLMVTDDEHKVFAISPDGSEVDMLTLTEKDDSFSDLVKNIKNLSVEASATMAGFNKGGTRKPFGGDDNAKREISDGSASMKLNDKEISASYKDEGAKVSAGVSVDGLSLSASEKMNIAKYSPDKEMKDEKDAKDTDFGVSLSVDLDFFKSSAKVERKSYSLSDLGIATGHDWSAMGGFEADASVSGSASVSGNKGGDAKMSIKFAEGGLGGTLVHKIPFYKGYVVHEAGISGSLGTEISWKSRTGKAKDGAAVDVTATQSVGALPLSVGASVKAFRFISQEDIDKAFAQALEK